MGMRARVAVLIVAALAGVAACGTSQPSRAPDATSSLASALPSVIPSERAPSLDARSFPTVTGQVLAAGRYASSPPFDIRFTFEVPATGWESMHLHGEFFDIGQFETDARPANPIRWIAWGHPQLIYGATEVAVRDLTRDEVIGLLTARDDLTASEPEPFTFAGTDGARVDLHAMASNTRLFGGQAGDFGLEPTLDARLGLVVVNNDLLVVMVLAPPRELEAAWQEAQPILTSVELDYGTLETPHSP